MGRHAGRDFLRPSHRKRSAWPGAPTKSPPASFISLVEGWKADGCFELMRVRLCTSKNCHAERSEASGSPTERQILRFAQDDNLAGMVPNCPIFNQRLSRAQRTSRG